MKKSEEMLVLMDTEFNRFKILTGEERHDRTRNHLLRRYEDGLDEEKIERFLEDLGSPLRYLTPFHDFFKEARELYREGFFHSCIAMCGITAEKISIDLLTHRLSITAIKGKEEKDVTEEVIKSFLELRFERLIGSIYHLGLIDEETKNALNEIRKKRNEYVHPKGPLTPSEDAGEVIRLLAKVIDKTSDVFKDFKMVDGKLVRK